jgi:heptosyltransferase-1
VRFDVPESASDRATAEAMIHGAGCQHGFCVVHPGAAWPSKRWLPARYAAVACHLGRTWGLPTMVVWAGDQARRWAEALVAGSQGHARLAEPMRLTELAALSRRARLYVGSDSGPLHLAAAVGTPCVGFYGPWPAERHGPYGPQHVVVQKMCFEGSTRQRRNASGKFMEAIDVESVSAACDQILSRDASHTAA